MPKVLGAKLFWVGILTALLGIYSVGVTLITGLTVDLSGLTAEVVFHGGAQIVLAGLTTYLVCNCQIRHEPRIARTYSYAI